MYNSLVPSALKSITSPNFSVFSSYPFIERLTLSIPVPSLYNDNIDVASYVILTVWSLTAVYASDEYIYVIRYSSKASFVQFIIPSVSSFFAFFVN